MTSTLYVLSPGFDYGRIISPAAGPEFAENYDWPVQTLEKCKADAASVFVVDNRFSAQEIPALKDFVEKVTGAGGLILLKMHDPFVEEQIDSPWLQFAWEMLDKRNVHYASVYSLAECVGALHASALRSSFIHIPYTYDRGMELPQDQPRANRIAFSGQVGSKYPLRMRFRAASRVNPLIGAWVSRLEHPGYPDIGMSGHANAVVGHEYLKRLSSCKYAFVCSSRCRLEFLKYREIAYAGCAPIGDLPSTFYDLPKDAFIPWHSMRRLPRAVQKDETWLPIAAEFRRFMETKRSKAAMKQRVDGQIASLLGTSRDASSEGRATLATGIIEPCAC